jgi:hypothetical protein
MLHRTGALMQYRLVYDVLDEGPPWFGAAIAILLLLFAVACFLEILERVRGRRRLRPMIKNSFPKSKPKLGQA